MGFPNDFKIPVSDTQSYRQFGNSVVVPVVAKIAQAMAICMRGETLPAIEKRQQELVFNESKTRTKRIRAAG